MCIDAEKESCAQGIEARSSLLIARGFTGRQNTEHYQMALDELTCCDSQVYSYLLSTLHTSIHPTKTNI